MHVKFPYQNGNKLIVSFLHIITEVEKKDGRMGKVKKFLKEFVEMMLESHMYKLELSQIYLDFDSMNTES